MKKIKFPLEMKDGHKVWELEELQQYFDLKKTVEYFANGKLQKWLEINYEDDIVEELEELTGQETDFVKRLTEALKVQEKISEIDVSEIFCKTAVKERLKRFLPEEEVETAMEQTVTNQLEFEHLVQHGKKKICLLSGTFCIRRNMKDLELLGVDEPVIEIEEIAAGKFYKQNIRLFGNYKADMKIKKILHRDAGQEVMLEFLDMLELYLAKLSGGERC